jgi:valyl-tRNA synthetase
MYQGDMTFVPENYGKTYEHWLSDIKDWCISRQLWWGHRMPVYYCDECGEFVVQRGGAPDVCPKCGGTHFTQENDTLDTWFSSALWPFSTLGWPEKTPELDYFYPTDVLVTGYDIIFFWVIRMMFSGIEQTGKSPFHHVLIHGLVRDDKGRKMSKSLGNGIDPLEVIDQYGADALRLTLMTGNAPGNDMRFYMERVENSRNFANKIWNASRFIQMNLEGFDLTKPEESDLKTEDRWILSLVNTLAKDVTENMDKYELGIAVSKVYDFIWEEFCDWYIEIVKPRMYNRDEDKVSANAALYTLKTVLSEALKLLHPYMPFITEEIYCSLNPDQPSIMVSAWPQYDEKRNDAVAENILTRAKDLVRGMRTVRKDMNVPPSKKAALIITSSDEKVRKLFEENTGIYAGLAGASEVTVQEGTQGVDQSAVSFVIPDTTVYIPLNELVDMEKEKERLCKEQKRLEGELKRSRAMLSNEKFLSKAPEAKVAEEKEKLAQYEQMMADVTARLEQM